MKKGIINAVTGILIGSLFMYLTLRNKPVGDILSLIFTVNTSWIIMAILMLVIVFIIRALRWRLLLVNSGLAAGHKDVMYSLLLGIFINSFTPKIGEIVRCTSLQKSAGIDGAKSFGTVISERIYDLIALIAGIIIILVFEFDRLGSLVGSHLASAFRSIGSNVFNIIIIIAIISALVLAGGFLSRKLGLSEKIRLAARGFMSGLRMTFRIRNSGLFLLQTVAIWSVMLLMNYFCLKALPSTEDMTLYFAMVALFVGTIGWAIPSPGGMGTSHFFILQLFILFGLKESTGIAYGLLVNGITILFTIAAGLTAIITVNIARQVKKHSLKKINSNK